MTYPDNNIFLRNILPHWILLQVGEEDRFYQRQYDRQFLNLEYLPQRLLWILDGELSRSEMMERLGLSHRTNFNENYIDKAFENGWIEMTIPDKPQSKKQRYRLTKVGAQEKEKIANDYQPD